jgi:hypothetical protein
MVTGIGGTGVLTVSALLGTAAHIEGLASTTADMAGLAQKGGAVYSHVRIAAPTMICWARASWPAVPIWCWPAMPWSPPTSQRRR